MIKMSGQSKGRKVLVFGLSHMNLKKLKEGLPIFIHGEEMGNPGMDMIIFSGKDERSMEEMVRPFLSPDTEVIDRTKERRN